MSARRGYLLSTVLLGSTLCLPALAQGGTIKAVTPPAVYSVELPGEKAKELVCTGDIRKRTATCAETDVTLCKAEDVKFREGLMGTVQTCKVTDCSPKQGMAAASGKCECKVKISDCR